MRRIYLFVVLVFSTGYLRAQSDQGVAFENLLAGTRYARVVLSASRESLIREDYTYTSPYNQFQHYLQSIGYEKVAMWSDEVSKLEKECNDPCMIADFELDFYVNKQMGSYNNYKNIMITVKDCSGKRFEFPMGNLEITPMQDVNKELNTKYQQMRYGNKPAYNPKKKPVKK